MGDARNTKSAKEKSTEKIKLLQDPVVSATFEHYFQRNWQAQRILEELRSAGSDLDLLREWAIYSFHALGTDEAEEKRKRGRMMRTHLTKAIIGYECAIAFYSLYVSAPHFNWPESKSNSNKFKQLVELNQNLANEAKGFLKRAAATEVYTTKRLGVTWQGAYLYLIKSYVKEFTRWDERKILEALTHLITAAHKSVRNRVPDDLRSLLRKTLRVFESDPKNSIIIERIRKAAAEPLDLSKMFPTLIPNRQ